MNVYTITQFECELCGHRYDNPDQALKCESIPVREGKGVKVGDLVRITAGDGAGSLARVTAVLIHAPGWGPPAYDHTVYLLANPVDDWGTRQLSFDSYEVVK